MFNTLTGSLRELGKMPKVIKTLLAGILLLLAMLVGYLISSQLSKNVEQDLMRIITIRNNLATVLSNMQDAETGQRGYLLTSNKSYLEPYDSAIAKMPQLLGELKGHLKDYDFDKDQVIKISSLANLKFEELQKTIDLHRRGRKEDALHFVNGGHGKFLMEIFRAEVGELEESSYAKFDETQKKRNVYRRVLGAFEIVSIVIIILIFYYVFMKLTPLFSELYGFNKRLKVKKKALEEKNEQLEHFAYIASHDLNEPLRTVTSFVALIEEEYKDRFDEDGLQYLSFITKATRRMQSMVSGLLAYSRIGTSGKIKKIDLNKALDNIKEDIQITIKQKNATIKHEQLPEIKGYQTEVRLLFQNLILNAIKFCEKEPIVQITFEDQDNFWQFCVEDNGIGIEARQQEKIFGIFSKLHLASEYEGQGIGLAFCKKIVELHQGEIWLESTFGIGSKFYFTLSKLTKDEKKAGKNSAG